MRRKETLRALLHDLSGYLPLVLLSLGLAALSVASLLYLPILTGNAVDLIIGRDHVDFDELFAILRRMGVTIIAAALFQWLQNVCNNRITYGVVRSMRANVYRKLMSLPLSYADTHAHGDLVSRQISDIDQLADGLLMGFTQLFSGALTIAGTLFFMFREYAWIALVVVILTPLSMVTARFISRYSYRMFTLQSEARGAQTALIHEMITHQKVVQAFGQEEKVQARFDGMNEKVEQYSLKAVFASSLTNPTTRFVNYLVYAAVAVAGAILVIKNPTFTAGSLTAFLAYANQYTKPFNEISGVLTELQNAFACAARVYELLGEQNETENALSPSERTPFDGRVAFENVSFSYVPEQKLIEDLNLPVTPGQRVAIVGPTGSGKTTLINLLMRFYEVDHGDIKVSGRSIYVMPRKEVRSGFGMVLQETWLRHGTIRDNIAFGKPDATEEEIIHAAKEAHAHSFIRRLPQGYDTVIGEDGGTLSEGQKQLLCIARVMLILPPMLILDEATSSIDTRTELAVQDAFLKMMEGHTSFIVAHRLSTIRSADIILVMRDGHIVEQGSHAELLAKRGFYAALYESQFG
ncbi:MAG: ABC transporter ATP-binding protein [Lachnospiraceae bacterium]|nr:ABC transporter ATP-binding protein [Lachnospiraceae bacterium]